MFRFITLILATGIKLAVLFLAGSAALDYAGSSFREVGGERGQALLGYLQHRAQIESAHLEQLASTAFSRMAPYVPTGTSNTPNNAAASWFSKVNYAAAGRTNSSTTASSRVRFSDEMILDR